MIEYKYSHGYKRNVQHLKGDRVMLPVADDGQPDYQFMENYIRELMAAKKKRYRQYVVRRLKSLGLDIADGKDYSAELKSREWKPIIIRTPTEKSVTTRKQRTDLSLWDRSVTLLFCCLEKVVTWNFQIENEKLFGSATCLFL